MPYEFGIIGLMFGSSRSSALVGEGKSSRRSNIPSSRMYSERVSSTSRTTNVSSRIFSEKVSTSRTTSITSKIFGEKVSTSKTSYVSSTKIISTKMAPSLKAKIPSTLVEGEPSSSSSNKPGSLSSVGGPHPPRNITRSRVKMEKAKYEKKILSTQVESRLPTSRTRKSLLPAPKTLPGSLRSATADSPCQSPTSPSTRSNSLLLGQRVGTADGRFGTLKFKGKTHFSQGCVCGIALDSPVGKNNGIIDGIQYFNCEPKHGIFIPTYKVNIVSPSGVTRLLETPPASPLSPRSDSSFSGKESKSHSKIPGVGNEKGKTSRPKTLQVFHESKTGTKQSAFKQGNKHGTDSKPKLSDRVKSTSGSKLFQNKKVSPVQSKLVLPGWTGDKIPGSPKPTSRLPELRSKCKSAATTVTVAKDEVTPEETAPAEKVRSKRTPEQGSPGIAKSAGYKHISRGLTSRPSLNDLTQLQSHDLETPLSTPSPLNHPDVLEGCVRVLNKTFDISETSPSSEEEELDVSCAVKPLPECVRTPRTLDLTFDLTPEGLPSVTCFPSDIKHQATSTPVSCEPREYCYKADTPDGVRELKQSPHVDIPESSAKPEKEEDIEYDEFLAVPSCLDTPTGKCRFDLLTPEEFEQALQECNLLYEEQDEEPSALDPKASNASPDRFKPKIWESITVVEDDLLTGLDSTFAEPSFLLPSEWSSMDEGSGNPQPPKRNEASADAEVPCLDKLPDPLSTPDTINGTFHGDLHAGVDTLLKRDEDFGIAQGGAPIFPDDVANNNNNVDFLVPEDTETDTSASGLQLSWENMEVESGQRSDDQLGDVAGAAPFQTVFDNDDALRMGSFSEMVMNDGEFQLHHDRPSMEKELKTVDEAVSPDHLEGESVCDRTFTYEDFPNVEEESQDSAMCERTFTVGNGARTPQPIEAHLDMFAANSNAITNSPPKSDTPIDTSSPDTPMEFCTGGEPSKAVTGPCNITDSQQDEVVAMDTVTGQQEIQKTVCGTVTVSGNDNGVNGLNSEGSSDSGSTMVEGESSSDKTLKRQASPPSELSTVVQVESVEMTSPSPLSIPAYTPSSSAATSPSQSGKDDSKDVQTKILLSKDDSRLPRKRSLLQQPKPISVSSSGSETSKTGPIAAPSESKAKLPRQKSHEQKNPAKDLKKDQSRKTASSSAMESLSKKTYTPTSWKSDKSATSSPSRSSGTSKPKTDASAKNVKLSGVRSKIDTGRRASDGGKNGQLLRKLHASSSSCDLEPNSLSSSTRSMRSDMSSNGGTTKTTISRHAAPVRRSAIPIRKNRQSYMCRPGKPVNKLTQSLKKREDKRRDRKTSTSSINSVESSQRADSRASLSSRPSSRSDVSPDAKPKKRPRQSVRKDIPFVHGKLNNPPQSPVNKSRLVKPSSSTIRKQSSLDRGQQSKHGGEASNGVVQIDAAPTRRPGHMSRSSMPSRRSVTGTDSGPSRIGRKPPSGSSKESAPDRIKLAKTKGHIPPPSQPDIVSPSLLSEINRLEALCEARTKELNLTRLHLKSNLQGFDAMSVLVQYLSHQLDAFSTPKLKEQLTLIERQLSTTNRQIEVYEDDISRLKSEIAAKEDRHLEEVGRTHDEYKNQLAQLEEALQNQHLEQVETLKQQHRQQLDNSELEHQNELSELAGVHRMAFREQEEQHIEQVTTIQQEHHDHIEEINREHQLQVEQLQAAAENEQRRLQDDVFTWKYQCESHKEKVAMLQDALRKDSDAKVQAAIAQYKHLPDEVESMKAVLEMKNTELHNLRIENMNLQKEVERIPDYQERIKRLETKVEELRAVVIRKQDYQRQLSSEHIALRENYQKETNEKKRLSMENEELAWKLSQSCEAVSPGALTPPRFNPSPSPTRPSRSFMTPSPTKPSEGFPRPTPAESPESGVFSPSNQQN